MKTKKVFVCPECQEVIEPQIEWQCGECEEVYPNLDDAKECCKES